MSNLNTSDIDIIIQLSKTVGELLASNRNVAANSFDDFRRLVSEFLKDSGNGFAIKSLNEWCINISLVYSITRFNLNL